MRPVSGSRFPPWPCSPRRLARTAVLPPSGHDGFGVHVLALARAPTTAVWSAPTDKDFRPRQEREREQVNIPATATGGRFPSISSTALDSAEWRDLVRARWGTGGACRPTGARPGPTGSSAVGPEWHTSSQRIVTRAHRLRRHGRRHQAVLGPRHPWSEITDSSGAPPRRICGAGPAQPVRAGARPRCRRQSVGESPAGARPLRPMAGVTGRIPHTRRCRPPAPSASTGCGPRPRIPGVSSGWGPSGGLYRLDPTRSAWLEQQGIQPARWDCGEGLPRGSSAVRRSCAWRGRRRRHARRRVREGGDALNVCDMTRGVTRAVAARAGVYAAGDPPPRDLPHRSATDPRGVTYQERPDTDSRGTRHTWFGRPIALTDQPYIDQTYRYGSTMGCNFQQHQGVEFTIRTERVYALATAWSYSPGRRARGHTVAIRHDRNSKAVIFRPTTTTRSSRVGGPARQGGRRDRTGRATRPATTTI